MAGESAAPMLVPPYRPDTSGRARALRRRYPRGAYFNIEHPDGRVMTYHFLDAGDPRPPEEWKVIGGPYEDFDLGKSRARPDTLYPYLFRIVLENGIIRSREGHKKVTLPILAEWTGFSVDALRAWRQPKTSKNHRPMPRSAIRLILHEFKAHDQSKYPWDRLLAMCR